MSPRLFSFNSPHGACAACDGLGALRDADEDLMIPDASLSINGNDFLTVGRRGDGEVEPRFVAVFGGGFDPGGASGNWLYMVDVETGRILYKRRLVGAGAGPPRLSRQ